MKRYTKEFLCELYRTMIRIRYCEEGFVEPILSGEVQCPTHLYSGQEAIATGACAALSDDDYVFGTHRSHGHYLAKGGGMNELVAEVYGKKTGCSKGRGGSMHIIDPENGIMGEVPIVGSAISMALGAALAFQIRKEKKVSVSFFGDAGAGQGVLHESLNFAALKKLPVVFVCENNFYSTHMPVRECRPDTEIYEIGRPFGIFSIKIDGNNVLEVYETSKKAIERCRNEEGPVFIECVTYRLRGHVGPDDNIQGIHLDIRPEAEVKAWKKKDPVINFEKFLLDNNLVEQSVIEKIKQDAVQEVDKAHLLAKSNPYPDHSEIADYVFKQ